MTVEVDGRGGENGGRRTERARAAGTERTDETATPARDATDDLKRLVSFCFSRIVRLDRGNRKMSCTYA